MICTDCDRRIRSQSCENVACKNGVSVDSVSESSGWTTPENDLPELIKTKRKTEPRPKLGRNKKYSGMAMNECQSRRDLYSDDNPHRRSPRNTPEAKSDRAKSRSKRSKEMRHAGEDLCGQLSKEKQDLAPLYLSEINRKFCSEAWKQ